MAKRRRTNNGLVLDFDLETISDRQNYVNNLVAEWQEAGKELREVDLTLLADYVLYGKDKDGLSPVKKKEVEIDTRYSTYERKNVPSLEQLMEQPSFDENILLPLTTKQPYKKNLNKKFDREEVSDIPEFHELWQNIDNLAAEIDFFEGKKELEDFSPEIQQHLKELKSSPTQLSLYKKKHTLIEMRREQFTLRDYFIPTTFRHTQPSSYIDREDRSIDWQSFDYEVLPLGVYNVNDPIFYLFLDKGSYINCSKKDAALLEVRKNYTPPQQTEHYLDFRNPEHLYQLFKFYEELRVAALDDPESTINLILNTLDFYIEATPFNEQTREILSLKIQKYPNEFISSYINNKYHKKHTPNYISTIFKGRICEDIAETAQLHLDTFNARNNPLLFKTCTTCGVTKLKDVRNFVRKSRSADGISSRCKECDKLEREELKGKKQEVRVLGRHKRKRINSIYYLY